MHKLTIVWLTIIFVSLMGYSLSPGFATATPVSAAESPSSTNGVLPDGLTLLKEDSWAEPEDAIAVGDWLLFRQGTELWKSDGTVTGTVVVAQNIFPFGMQACNGQLYFRHTEQLFAVDPVNDTQQLIKDDFKGPWNAETVRCASDRLFFLDTDDQYGQELWQTNGAFAGTSLVKDINPGRNGSGVQKLFLFEDQVFFTADTGQSADELWVSDGTLTGTQSLTTLAAPITAFAATQETLFFRNGCCQLWHVNEGITGAELLKDFATEGVSTVNLFSARTLLYLTADQPISDTTEFVHSTLWRSDGSVAETRKLHEYVRHTLTLATQVIGNRILFEEVDQDPKDGSFGESRLLISDGTITETTDIPFDLDYTRFYPEIALPQFPDQTIAAYDSTLWRTDGTITNTVTLTNVRIGPHTLYPRHVTQFGNYFAYTQPDDHLSGIPLWISDGTPEGSKLLVDFAPEPGSYGTVTHNTNAKGTLFFVVAGGGSDTDGLWAYHPGGETEEVHTLYLPLINSE